jgi:putative oxidoreductase
VRSFHIQKNIAEAFIKTTDMERISYKIMKTDLGSNMNNLVMLFFRVTVALELILAHGLKKVGVRVAEAEKIPNPLHLPEDFNNLFAIAANLFFPLFIIAGFFTRLATIPILAVTLTGYFIVHWNDSLLEKDTPLIYSLCFLFILIVGAGRYSLDHKFSKRRNKIEKLPKHDYVTY